MPSIYITVASWLRSTVALWLRGFHINFQINLFKGLQLQKDDFEEAGGKDFVKPMLDVRAR
jgi:hypothetical protein